MVNANHGVDILPLQAQYMIPPRAYTHDLRQQKCKFNTMPTWDEYVVDNFEDELDGDNQFLEEPDDDDETSEALIKAYIPHNNQIVENETQQVTQSQGLSPRGFQHDKFHFKKQDVNSVTAGIPNTRFFYSRSSQ